LSKSSKRELWVERMAETNMTGKKKDSKRLERKDTKKEGELVRKARTGTQKNFIQGKMRAQLGKVDRRRTDHIA